MSDINIDDFFKWVKGTERLVHQQNRRVARKGAGESNSLLHST